MKTPMKLTDTISYPSFDELKKAQAMKSLRDLSSEAEDVTATVRRDNVHQEPGDRSALYEMLTINYPAHRKTSED